MPRPDRSRIGHTVESIHFHRREDDISSIRCACGWEAETPDQERIAALFVTHRTETLKEQADVAGRA